MALPSLDLSLGGFRLTINVATVIAFVMAQGVNMVWEKGKVPSPTLAILCDAGLIVFIKLAMQNGIIHVSNGKEAVRFGVWAAMLYGCLAGPHLGRSLLNLLIHLCYKFLILLVICCALDYFRNI